MSGTGGSTPDGSTRYQLRRVRWWEIPRLAALASGKFLEHRTVRFGWLGQGTCALWLFTMAFLTYASSGAWSGPGAVVYSEESAEGGSLSILRALLIELVILGPLVVLAIRFLGLWPAVLLLVAIALGASEWLRRHRRTTAVLRKARRQGAPFLTWFASGRKGAGRALLGARCALADERDEWLCLEAPELLIGYYSAVGFRPESEIVAVGRMRRVYMERPPPSHGLVI